MIEKPKESLKKTISTVAPRYFSLKERNKTERPREKLLSQGARTLTTAELLGLLIGSGVPKQSATDLAQCILHSFDHNLSRLSKASIEELLAFKGIGEAKAALIAGALELGKRLQDKPATARVQVHCAQDAYSYMRSRLLHRVVEEFWILLLNKANILIKAIQLSTGGISRTTVDNGVLFKHCLLHNAVGLILVHNHPSGSLKPSKADIAITQKIKQGGLLFHIHILDHLIFTDEGYFSFAEEQLLGSLEHI